MIAAVNMKLRGCVTSITSGSKNLEAAVQILNKHKGAINAN